MQCVLLLHSLSCFTAYTCWKMINRLSWFKIWHTAALTSQYVKYYMSFLQCNVKLPYALSIVLMEHVLMKKPLSHLLSKWKCCCWQCNGRHTQGKWFDFSLSGWLPPSQQVAGSVWHNYIQTWRVFLFFQNLPRSASSRTISKKDERVREDIMFWKYPHCVSNTHQHLYRSRKNDVSNRSNEIYCSSMRIR